MRVDKLLGAVPWQVWAVAAFAVTSAYVVRRSGDAAGRAVDAVVGAVGDAATGAARVVAAPVVIAYQVAKSAGVGAPASGPGIAAADAAFSVGGYVADVIQSVPGATGVLDFVFGAVDKVAGKVGK